LPRRHELSVRPLRFFFAEWMTSAEGLYEEVHHLAYHYHWREQDILELPRSKRRRYLALLASKLEQLQGNDR
jgi:hypothetical protein